MTFDPLDRNKAVSIDPLGDPDRYCPGPYIQPGTAVTVTVESREQELAILAAYDYGLDALSPEGRHQVDRLIAALKTAITGR